MNPNAEVQTRRFYLAFYLAMFSAAKICLYTIDDKGDEHECGVVVDSGWRLPKNRYLLKWFDELQPEHHMKT